MNMIFSFSSPIGPIITSYLTLQQALGRQCYTYYKVLKQLDNFLSITESDLTSESFSTWCFSQQHLSNTMRREKMRIAYNLCLYRQRRESTCFVPDPSQFPRPNQPIQPYIFTETEIVGLFKTIEQLDDRFGLRFRKEIIRVALTLFYTSGLRHREMCRLKIEDYNPKEHTLLIRESKFHKSRLIPLSTDGWKTIEEYLEKRRHCGFSVSGVLPLIFNNKTPSKFYGSTGLWRHFKILFKLANVYTISGHKPRIHDLRHTFATHVLLGWYRENADVQAKLPYLCKYMGHVSIESTQYYLRFIEPIVNSASKRFEKYYGTFGKELN